MPEAIYHCGGMRMIWKIVNNVAPDPDSVCERCLREKL